jgi:hypothetical protein
VLVNSNVESVLGELEYENLERAIEGNVWKSYKGSFRNDAKVLLL